MIWEITYTLMDPTRNYTILAETEVPEELQPAVAAELMKLEPLAEQAGFLTENPHDMTVLRMAGGEFCGNAAMSAAVWCAEKKKVQNVSVRIRVSGTAEPVTVFFQKEAAHSWRASVTMPAALSVSEQALPGGCRLPVVAFDGIAHVILENPSSKPEAEKLAKQWCAFLKQEAIGLMYYDRTDSVLSPLVYVPGADTMCWENACGSGSSAVGAYLAFQQGKSVTVFLKQPGGILEVHAEPDGSVILSGSVKPVHRKTVTVDL